MPESSPDAEVRGVGDDEDDDAEAYEFVCEGLWELA